MNTAKIEHEFNIVEIITGIDTRVDKGEGLWHDECVQDAAMALLGYLNSLYYNGMTIYTGYEMHQQIESMELRTLQKENLYNCIRDLLQDLIKG